MSSSVSDITKKLFCSKYPPLGELAVHYGTITKSQLEEAFALFSRKKKAELGDVLVEEGICSPRQIELLSSLLDFYEKRDSGTKFGALAMQRGYTGQKGVESALSTQLRLFRKSKVNKRIGDIMVEAGTITPAHRDLVMAELAGLPKKETSQAFEITYYFETGKHKPVIKGSVLAKKTEVSGGDPVLEVKLKCGSGTRLSRDGNQVIAAREGIPSLSIDGSITVSRRVSHRGNTSYRIPITDSRENLDISGTLFQKQTVIGCNISADEIRRTRVEATGEIHISAGITDARVSCQGSIRAKYLHNSVVDAFGDIVIEHEIIDCKITTSGELRSVDSKIISSEIAAKKGIYAAGTGTDLSDPCLLKIGVDDHIRKVAQGIDREIEAVKRELDTLLEKKETLTLQIGSQQKSLAKQKPHIDKMSRALEQLPQNQESKALQQKISLLKEKLSTDTATFKRDLTLTQEMTKELGIIAERIHEIREDVEKEVQALEEKKRTFREWADKIEPVPTLEIRDQAVSGTMVSCENSCIKLDGPRNHFTVREAGLKGSKKGETILKVSSLIQSLP